MRLLYSRQSAWRWLRQLKRRITAARQGEKPPAGAALLYRAQADHNQRGSAHTPGELECCATSQRQLKPAYVQLLLTRQPARCWRR